MLQRPLQEPGGQCLEGLAAGLAIAERGLERLAMGLTGWRAGARGGADVGLPRAWRRDKRHGGGWGTAEVGRHTAPASLPLPKGAVARIGTPRLRHAGPVAAVAYSPDGRWIASADEEGTACVWEAATGKRRHRFTLGKPIQQVVGFSADSKTFLTFATDKGQPGASWLPCSSRGSPRRVAA